MRKYIALIIFTVSTWTLSAQSSTDLATLLELSVNLPALQAHYPDSPIEEKETVYVVQENYAFPAGLLVLKFNKPIEFVAAKADVQSLNVASLAFTSLLVDGDNASAAFEFTYPNPYIKAHFEVNIEYQRVGVSWIIINYQLNLE